VEDILERSAELEISETEIRRKVRVIEETLHSFGVPGRVVEVNQGPTVTQFGVEPGYVERKGRDGSVSRAKVKVSKIGSLAKDLSLALAATAVRIEAPVPGRSMIGIEVPNDELSLVSLRRLMESNEFQRMTSRLKIALGQDVSGNPVVADLGRMPHLLIAGATGSGKSVCINSIVTCLLLGNTPEDLRLLMVDPKMVELVNFNGIPHLLSPVLVEVERVVGTLRWVLREMDRRYKLFSAAQTRSIDHFNQNLVAEGGQPIPYIVVVVDELADLMMAAPDEVERSLCRLAQMSRATGIHLVVATQRPSVDVVTGLIKANFPARISFAVTSQADSRVILDVAGADKLLGKGDMLYMSADSSSPIRLQGCFVSNKEIDSLVRFWRGMEVPRPAQQEELVQQAFWPEMATVVEDEGEQEDQLLEEAIGLVKREQHASTTFLQRRLRIGYVRAARLMDLLEEKGIVGPPVSAGRARKVLHVEEEVSWPTM
jgi:S-DNA-T family DNA segregation ATPase FtsK/SpoIIIE